MIYEWNLRDFLYIYRPCFIKFHLDFIKFHEISIGLMMYPVLNDVFNTLWYQVKIYAKLGETRYSPII